MTSSAPAQPVKFGIFVFDPSTGELWKAGRATRLQEQPRLVLTMLVARPGELITREDLRAALWPSDTFVDFDTGLNVVVNKLRQALGDSASAPRFIETLPRRGYRFVAPVSQVVEPAATRSEVRRGRPTRALVGASLLAVAAAFWAWTQSRTVPVPTGSPIKSLAVLPLENLSGNPGEDHVVDGVTDALTTNLAAIRALRVISRQSTKQFKGSTKPVTTIARELAVDAIVQGSVVRTGDRIRLSLQLIDARDDRHLWTRAYENDLGGILRLQRAATEAIAGALRVSLTPGERARLGHARTVDPAAHDAYMRGRYILTGLAESEANVTRALEEFARAIALDPTYAPAYVGIAEARQVRATYLGGHPPQEERQLAFEAARRALALDEEIGEAHAILARVQLSEFDWDGAERSFARMLELAPQHAPGLVWYAYSLLLQGRPGEALEVARRAESVDPKDLNTRVRVGFVHRFVGRRDEAIRRYVEVLSLDPTNIMARQFASTEYAALGKEQEALEIANQMLERLGRTPLVIGQRAAVRALTGHRDEARQLIDELLAMERRQYVSPAHLAFAYVSLGDRDRAFHWLERAYLERSNLMMYVPIEPSYAMLADDPRFADLVRRIKMPHTVRGVSAETAASR